MVNYWCGIIRRAPMSSPKNKGSATRQSEQADDPYRLSIVKHVLKFFPKKMFLSVAMKRVTWLGDGVSIALLKILTPESLADPKAIIDFLPIIRDSFSHVDYIERESDKKPSVTLFLLTTLEERVKDPELREEIRRTVQFVRKRTGG